MTPETESKPILEQFTVVKRGISYRRVSTDEQADKGYSLPTQSKEIEAYAAKNGIELVEDFYDDYTGSKLDERPGLTQARQWLRSGKADCIICWDSDRLTREPSHYMRLRDEFKAGGIELHYARRGQVDLNDFGQMLVEDFYGRFNHQWKAKLVENCTNGRREKAQQGHVVTHGHPPFGYRDAKTEDGKNTLAIYEPEAKIVRLIFRLYAVEDKGYHLIAQHLTALGVPTAADGSKYTSGKKRNKGEWSTASVQRILGRETYIGRWAYSKGSGEPIEITVPAIIDPATWQATQKKRQSNKGGRLAARYEYLLSGRGICDCCKSPTGGRAAAWKSKNKKGVTLYYHCNAANHIGAKVGISCTMPYFRADQLEKAVWDWIITLILDPEKLEAGLKKYQERNAGEAEAIQEEIDRTAKLINKKRIRLERARNLYLDGDEDKAAYLVEKRNLEADINGLETDLENLREKLNSVSLSPERIASIHALAAEVREYVKLLDEEPDFPIKRKIINILDVRVRLNIEAGEKIAYASCVLDPNAPLLLPIDYTSSKRLR